MHHLGSGHISASMVALRDTGQRPAIGDVKAYAAVCFLLIGTHRRYGAFSTNPNAYLHDWQLLAAWVMQRTANKAIKGNLRCTRGAGIGRS